MSPIIFALLSQKFLKTFSKIQTFIHLAQIFIFLRPLGFQIFWSLICTLFLLKVFTFRNNIKCVEDTWVGVHLFKFLVGLFIVQLGFNSELWLWQILRSAVQSWLYSWSLLWLRSKDVFSFDWWLVRQLSCGQSSVRGFRFTIYWV